MIELKRTKLEMPEETIDEGLLAQKASDLLGYKPLESMTTSNRTQRTAVKTLVELGIDPLDAASVEAYKAAMLKKKNTLWRKFNSETFQWRFMPLRSYREKIPPFALSRAIEIRERMPNAEFYVCAMRNQTEMELDPFLVLSEGVSGSPLWGWSELPWAIYLDVWDEPSFEGRRTV